MPLASDLMYVSLSRLRVDAEASDRLVDAFRNRLGAVDGHDGFMGLEVWRSDRDAGEVLMVSRWRDREAFKAYMRSDDHQRSHRRIPDSLSAAIELERLEHLHTYEVVGD
jgi:heme oxygenase (mycobilin-producing)